MPVYISAHGPKGLELAGRIADSVIVGSGFTGPAIDFVRRPIARGVRASGRQLADLDVWYLAYTALAEDDRTARDQFGSILVGNLPGKRETADKGLPEDVAPKLKEPAGRYDYGEHVANASGSSNAMLLNELGVLDYLLERFAVVARASDAVNA